MNLADFDEYEPISLQESYTATDCEEVAPALYMETAVFRDLQITYRALTSLMERFSNVQAVFDSFDDQCMDVARAQYATVQCLRYQKGYY